MTHVCVDCAKLPDDERPARPRPATHGGPRSRRCTTHHRALRAGRKTSSWAGRLMRVHGMTEEQYWSMYEAQGRKCALPRCRATGKTRKLAVDHDHDYARRHCSHDPDRESCSACWRGLCCYPHNFELLGKFAGDLEDALTYLRTARITRR
jgi:hypothetical protein